MNFDTYEQIHKSFRVTLSHANIGLKTYEILNNNSNLRQLINSTNTYIILLQDMAIVYCINELAKLIKDQRSSWTIGSLFEEMKKEECFKFNSIDEGLIQKNINEIKKLHQEIIFIHRDKIINHIDRTPPTQPIELVTIQQTIDLIKEILEGMDKAMSINRKINSLDEEEKITKEFFDILKKQ